MNVPDEAKAALVQRPNERLVVPIVAERAPRSVDPAAERSFRDDSTVPDRLDQLILADDPVVVAHEIGNEVEDLRFDMNEFASPAQLLLAEVDFEPAEPVFQQFLR
nr:hypothetical protein [Bradyrhizobium lablabi]